MSITERAPWRSFQSSHAAKKPYWSLVSALRRRQESRQRKLRRTRREMFETLEQRIALDGTPVISEFMAKNDHTLTDEDGDYSDWLEIYNPTNAAVDLSGWYLTDKLSAKTEWQFPATPLDPGHFVVVFASGKDRAVSGSELHTNFKLSESGEYLALVEPDGVTVASEFNPEFPQQFADVSYGRAFTASNITTVSLNASADTWIREKEPNKNWENDSISVWATDGGPTRRYGIIEWDISSITQPITGAHIELYNANGGAVSQQAYLIPSGLTGMTWNTYLANDQPQEAPLTSLGSGSFGAGGIGSYASTFAASAADLEALNNLRTTTGKVTIVFKATSGARDWGDKDFNHKPAHLVLDYGTAGTITTDLRYFATPTPAAMNQGGALGVLATPTISVAHGFFTSAFDTVISSPVPGSTLVYTTDGSDPSLTNGVQVPASNGGATPSATIHVSHTSTLRAAAFATNYIPSEANTVTYLFLADVVQQSPQGQAPAGWPAGSINGQVLNYGMDPDIVGNGSIAGDFNADSKVDLADYNILTAHWLQTVPAGTLGDMDHNGKVDLADFTLFKPLYTAAQSGQTNGGWGPQLMAGLTAIPSISLVLPLANLFDPTTGIYVNASQSGSDWERSTSVELINPDGSPGFQIDAGLRIRGNFSTSGANPKHAFRLFFDSSEGALNYPLFGSDGTTSYEKLDLRTDENDNWAFTGSTQDTFVNDVFARDTQFAMGDPSTRSEYYHLYINGQYWGIYQSQERPSKEFAASYFGGDASNYDVIKSSGGDGGYTTEATDGNLDAWSQLWQGTQVDLADNAAYYKLQGLNPDGTRNPAYPVLLNVDNLIDYMLINFYMDNEDAPLSLPLDNNKSNNWYAIRDRTGDQGFQFFAFDSEQTLFSKYNVGGLNGDRTGPFHGSNEHDFSYSNPQWVHQALMANAEYRMEFADRVQKAFFDSGALTTGAVQQRFLARAAEVGPAMVGESARWGDAYSTRVNNPLTKNDWQSAVDNDVNNYFPYRGNIVLDQLRADSLFPAVAAPTYSQHGGVILQNATIMLAAAQGGIYYTLDGSDPRLIGGGISPTAHLYSGPITISQPLTVKARALSGGVWSAANVADFTFNIPQLRITEMMYHPADPPTGSPFTAEDFEFVELQNIGTSTIALGGMQFVLGITYTFPSMNLAPGQYVVLAKNLSAFASRYPGVTAIGPYGGNLSNSGETVTLNDSLGQTVQSFTYVDSWYPTTDGSGKSLVVVNPLAAQSAWNSPTNWRASTNLNGSPGVVDPSGGAASASVLGTTTTPPPPAPLVAATAAQARLVGNSPVSLSVALAQALKARLEAATVTAHAGTAVPATKIAASLIAAKSISPPLIDAAARTSVAAPVVVPATTAAALLLGQSAGEAERLRTVAVVFRDLGDSAVGLQTLLTRLQPARATAKVAERPTADANAAASLVVKSAANKK